MKQSLAIAYAMKKKAQKMFGGGRMEPKPTPSPSPDPTPSQDPAKTFQDEKKKKAKDMGIEDQYDNMKNLNEGDGMAKGGFIKDNHQSSSAKNHQTNPDMKDHNMDSGFVEHQGNDVKSAYAAGLEAGRKLGQHGDIEQGPYGTNMAEGGQITDNYSDSEADDMDMIGRIMKQRQMHFSKGGKVANGGEDKLSHMADGDPNNFDDLSLRDDLESSYTGKNSGDMDGNEQDDDDKSDIVSKIMKSRAKKDRMPSPA